MATVIGTVTNITGMAIVVDDQGKRHLLKKGEALHEGDRVITSQGANVTVSMTGGESVKLLQGQTVKLTDQLAQTDVTDPSENIVNQAVFKQIIAALKSGQDITQLLDAAATGQVDSDGDNSFVNLDRIATDVNGLGFLQGGSGPGDFGNKLAENLRYFFDDNKIIPPPSSSNNALISPNIIINLGGVINYTDTGSSLLNANGLVGVLTDSITLTDNTNSLVNAGVVTGVLSGDTKITDNSLSLVNAGVVPSVLSGNTNILDNSTSLVNAGVVPGVLSGDTTLTDNTTSLVNSSVVPNLLSGDSTLSDGSNSIVNAGLAGNLLGGESSVTDNSNSLINAGVVPSILSGGNNVTDNSSSLVGLDVVPSVLSGPASITDNSSSPIDLDVALGALTTDGNALTPEIGVDIFNISEDVTLDSLLDPTSTGTALLSGDLLTDATDSVPEILGYDYASLNNTPDGLAITGDVLNSTVGELLDPANPLSAAELLGIDNTIDPGLNLQSFTDTTTITSDALSLIKDPVLLSTVKFEQTIIDLG